MQKPSDHQTSSIVMSKEGFQSLMDTQDGKNFHWTTDINVELPIKMPLTGKVSQLKPTTLPRYFRSVYQNRQHTAALKVKRGNKKFTWTWSQYYDEAFAFAKGLAAIGIDERKAVNIMGFNSPEWVIAMFGSQFHNNVVSGIYITNGAEACEY
jgi:long-chain-fatty-acid--CoA ligase ACSBG